MNLLAHADENTVYSFLTQQGTVSVRGASPSALRTDDASLAKTMLYCCDAPAEASPRLLGAAARMQLLSAEASLVFANVLATEHDADSSALEPVWQQLLESPKWHALALPVSDAASCSRADGSCGRSSIGGHRGAVLMTPIHSLKKAQQLNLKKTLG